MRTCILSKEERFLLERVPPSDHRSGSEDTRRGARRKSEILPRVGFTAQPARSDKSLTGRA